MEDFQLPALPIPLWRGGVACATLQRTFDALACLIAGLLDNGYIATLACTILCALMVHCL